MSPLNILCALALAATLTPAAHAAPPSSTPVVRPAINPQPLPPEHDRPGAQSRPYIGETEK